MVIRVASPLQTKCETAAPSDRIRSYATVVTTVVEGGTAGSIFLGQSDADSVYGGVRLAYSFASVGYEHQAVCALSCPAVKRLCVGIRWWERRDYPPGVVGASHLVLFP